GEGQADAEIVHPHIDSTKADAEEGAKPRPERLHVADALQIFVYRALFIGFHIGGKLIALTAILHRFEGGFRTHDAGEDRVVAALDARHVDEARRTTDQRTAREDQLGHGLETTLGDRARAVGNALAANKGVFNRRMVLEALELVEGREIGALVVQVNHEAHGNKVVAEVIKEGAATG